MNELDLDQLRGSWRQQSRRIDATLSLDIERVRARLQLRTQSAFQRHTRWLLLALGFGAATLLALTLFIVQHRQDAAYLVASVPLLGLLLAEFVTDFRQWRTLARLDTSRPIAEVRAVLQTLRTRRLRMLRCVLLSCVLLWLPALAVLLKGLFGADLLRGLPFRVILANLLLGLAGIPLGMWLMRWLSKRLSGAPAWQRLVYAASGRGFSAAHHHFESQFGFEEKLSQSADARAVLQQINTNWPASVEALLDSLQRNALASMLFYAALLPLIGSFNFAHGAEPQFLLPGLLLHFILVAQIIAAVVHRVRLLQIGPARPLDLHSQLLALSKISQWRAKLARISLIALPVALLALLQVLAKACCGIDLFGAASSWLALAVGLSTSFSCGWLALQLRRDRDFAPRTLDLLSLGALARMDALVQALEASAVSREAE